MKSLLGIIGTMNGTTRQRQRQDNVQELHTNLTAVSDIHKIKCTSIDPFLHHFLVWFQKHTFKHNLSIKVIIMSCFKPKWSLNTLLYTCMYIFKAKHSPYTKHNAIYNAVN